MHMKYNNYFNKSSYYTLIIGYKFLFYIWQLVSINRTTYLRKTQEFVTYKDLYTNKIMHYTYALHRSKYELNYIFGSYGGYVMILCSKIKFRSQVVVYQILLEMILF